MVEFRYRESTAALALGSPCRDLSCQVQQVLAKQGQYIGGRYVDISLVPGRCFPRSKSWSSTTLNPSNTQATQIGKAIFSVF